MNDEKKASAQGYILYSMAGCNACAVMKRLLKKRSLPFEERDATVWRETIAGLTGDRQLPIIVTPSGHVFSGLRIEELEG